jgi:hypothetical protein
VSVNEILYIVSFVFKPRRFLSTLIFVEDIMDRQCSDTSVVELVYQLRGPALICAYRMSVVISRFSPEVLESSSIQEYLLF